MKVPYHNDVLALNVIVCHSYLTFFNISLGYLRKHKKRFMTQWHKRFCVLVDEYLFYFKNETDKKEQGVIILPLYTMTVPPKDKGFVFTLESTNRNTDCYSVSKRNQIFLEILRSFLVEFYVIDSTERLFLVN